MNTSSSNLVRIALVASATAAVLAAVTSGAVAAARVHAPLGYQLMCLQHPGECEDGGTASVNVSKTSLATIQRVNRSVNARIRPQAEGRDEDVWQVSAISGDCEEYALAKRRALIIAGFSPSSLRLAYVKMPSGQGHAVLLVETNVGELVLDNLTGRVKPVGQTGLRLVAHASADPDKWI